jgi:tetratricopeptide (TPR) repeat protein
MNSEPETQCPSCGRKLSAGEACQHCASLKVFRLIQREMWLLLVLILVAVGTYFVTRAFANANHEMKVQDAAEWYRQGERLLQGGRPQDAVAAFRKASLNDRDKELYTRALARALEAAGRDSEAREILLQLREDEPEDPNVNVELARIAAKERDVPQAIQYYHHAIYGIWTGEDVDARREQVRLELIQLLIAHQARDQALAETVALASQLPATVAAHVELGNLFLHLGNPALAVSHFNSALHLEPHNRAAVEGAGRASFETGNYRAARRLLDSLPSTDPEIREMRELATLFIENDPLEPRLSNGERNRRLIADFNQATLRIRECLARDSAQGDEDLKSLSKQLNDFHRLLTSARLKKDSDLAVNALELIYKTETAASKACGPPQDLDKALTLIARKERGSQP